MTDPTPLITALQSAEGGNRDLRCPHCGAPIEAPPEAAALTAARFPHQEQLIVNELVRRYPASIRLEHLIDVLYGHDPNGGPEAATSAIRVRLTMLRKRLRPLGWTVSGGRVVSGYTGYYRLERIAA